MTTRQEYSDSTAYAKYVGPITSSPSVPSVAMTPAEFVAPYGGDVEEAVSTFLGQGWPYKEQPPNWLEAALKRYIANYLELDAKAKVIRAEYAQDGIDLELGVAWDIARFEADDDLWLSNEVSPDGLDPDREPIDTTGMTSEEVEAAVTAQAIADAYGCALASKPDWDGAEEGDFAFPSVERWCEWHMETLLAMLDDD
jgi:hypothetical protein